MVAETLDGLKCAGAVQALTSKTRRQEAALERGTRGDDAPSAKPSERERDREREREVLSHALGLTHLCAHAHAHSQTDGITHTDGISHERHTKTQGPRSLLETRKSNVEKMLLPASG